MLVTLDTDCLENLERTFGQLSMKMEVLLLLKIHCQRIKWNKFKDYGVIYHAKKM